MRKHFIISSLCRYHLLVSWTSLYSLGVDLLTSTGNDYSGFRTFYHSFRISYDWLAVLKYMAKIIERLAVPNYKMSYRLSFEGCALCWKLIPNFIGECRIERKTLFPNFLCVLKRRISQARVCKEWKCKDNGSKTIKSVSVSKFGTVK